MTYTLIFYRESDYDYDNTEASEFELTEFDNEDDLIEHWALSIIDGYDFSEFILLIDGTKSGYQIWRAGVAERVEVKKEEIRKERIEEERRQKEEFAEKRKVFLKEEAKRKLEEARKLLEENGFTIKK